jgi:hypothetical protein
MKGRVKLYMVKYKAITNDWNYDASCTLTSLPVLDFENFKRLVFVVQSIQIEIIELQLFSHLLYRLDQEGILQECDNLPDN